MERSNDGKNDGGIRDGGGMEVFQGRLEEWWMDGWMDEERKEDGKEMRGCWNSKEDEGMMERWEYAKKMDR